MTIRHVVRIAAVLLTIHSVAQAESLGDAINRSLKPGGAATLAELPPELLGSLHVVSELSAWHRQGQLPDEVFAEVLATEFRSLAARRAELDALSTPALRAALILEARVLLPPARELLRSLEHRSSKQRLSAAVAEHVEALRQLADRQLHAGEDGPDNACFLQYTRCMEYCSELETWIERGACGMDCSVDLAVCLGRAAGRGGLDLIETVDRARDLAMGI